MITVRMERPEDVSSVRNVNQEAFEEPTEANLVDELRQGCSEALSLVAEDDGCVIGHILFTPVVVSNGDKVIQGMGLAPMAVVPERQREGLGTRLVEYGIKTLQDRSCPFVIVLGHPEYYPRFGFVPASRHNLNCQWEEVPDEAFMVLVMDENVVRGVSGVVRYRDEFDQAI